MPAPVPNGPRSGRLRRPIRDLRLRHRGPRGDDSVGEAHRRLDERGHVKTTDTTEPPPGIADLPPGRSRSARRARGVSAELPGDALITFPDLVTTRSITIHAEIPEVWPWIAQIGQGRGGLYSYDRLENLLGCDIHSADRIHPEWQHVEIGDEVRLAPEMALTVAVADLPRALVLRSGKVPMGALGSPFDFTWAFTLHPVPGGGTRLIVRERYAYRCWWAAVLVRPTSVVSAVMSRRMLHGIRDRAEGHAAPGQVPGDAPTCERASAADASTPSSATCTGRTSRSGSVG